MKRSFALIALLSFLAFPVRAEDERHSEDETTQATPAPSDEGGGERVDGHSEARRAAEAKSPSASRKAFCSKPHGEICEKSLPRSEFEEARDGFQASVIDEKFDALSGNLRERNFDAFLSQFIRMTDASEAELRKRLGEDFDLKSQFEGEIKRAQLAAIQAHTDIPARTRLRMAAEVQRARFFLPSEYLRNLQLVPPSSRRRFMRFYQSTCGQLGLSDNAFSFGGGDARGGPGIVICPGTWLAGIALKAHNGTSVKDYIIFTLGHELGHTVGASSDSESEFNPVYRKMLECFARTPAGQGFRPATVLDGRGTRVPNNRGLRDYMDEITADYWAAETLARLRPSASADEMLRLAKSTLSDMCPSAGNAEHPPGKFRVTFMATNPRLLGRLGCPQPTRENPVCAVEGVVPQGNSARGSSLAERVRNGKPRAADGGINKNFFDSAQQLLDVATPRQAFDFLRGIRNREARRAFGAMFDARYLVDPAALRRAFFDPKTDPGLREVARRELARRLKRPGVDLIASSFGQRPEHAVIFEDRLRRALSRGAVNEAAGIAASLMGTLSPAQTEKALESLEREQVRLTDPQDKNLVSHLIFGAREALGRGRPASRNEAVFRSLFARRADGVKTGEREFRETLDRAVEGDASGRDQLVARLNPESVRDVMRHQLAGGDEAMAVKLAKVFGRRDADGSYHLDLASRSLDFGQGDDTPHEILRLGKSDAEIKEALRSFPDLQRFTIDPEAVRAANHVFVRANGKGGVETYSPGVDTPERITRPIVTPTPTPTPERVTRPATLSDGEAASLMKAYCARCHGAGGTSKLFLDADGKLDASKVSLAAMLKNVRRDDGSSFMPPIGTKESLALYPKDRNALAQWLETKIAGAK